VGNQVKEVEEDRLSPADREDKEVEGMVASTRS
jgi:hypothetical protein